MTVLELHTDELILARYRSRYATQDKVAALLAVMVKGLAAVVPRRKAASGPVKRILIANAGHIGDAIMSTSVLAPLKMMFPEAEIDLLTNSESRSTVVGHPLINQVHVLDHWSNSRAKSRKIAKILQYYMKDLPRARRKLKLIGYDLAIDLFVWFPNYVPLLWAANIPIRVGCDRFGFNALLTLSQPFPYDRRHETEHMGDLLRLLGASPDILAMVKPNLPPVGAKLRQHVQSLLPDGPYRILHPASSLPTKDWVIACWIELAARLSALGVTPVITGRGERDAIMAAAITAKVPGAIDAVGRLSWAELGAVISGAELIYCVDTSIGHYGRALGRPVVSIYGGMADSRRFAPAGAAVVTNTLPCSPCFQHQGCAHRNCITQIPVDRVLSAAETLLKA